MQIRRAPGCSHSVGDAIALDADHIALCGGGSGGHLTPAIAVAEQILTQSPSARVTFFISGRDVDERVMNASGLQNNPRVVIVPLALLRMPGFRRTALTDAWRLWRSCRDVSKHFSRDPPDVVFGTGGFAAVPGMLAASFHRIPLILFEANVESGRANRWFASLAVLRLVAWKTERPDAIGSIGDDHRIVVGMPLRVGFRDAAESTEKNGQRTLLVLGGSQGSQRLNHLMTKALSADNIPGEWKAIHQTGPHRPERTPFDPRITQVPFIDDIATTLRKASLVVSRAGAITLSELAASGCPAILVPLNGLAGNHQCHNAAYFEDAGAAIVIDETASDAAAQLAESLTRLMTDEERRSALGKAIRQLHAPDGAAEVARILLERCQTSSEIGRR